MKLENGYYIRSLGIIFCHLVIFVIGFPQSGRTVVMPPPEVAVATTEISKNGVPCEKGLEEVLYIPVKNIGNFIEELNRFGNCGYRLEKATKLSLAGDETFNDLGVAGIIKLNPGNKYEYDWFESFSPGETITRINYRTEKGFYFRRNFLFTQGKCSTKIQEEKKDQDNSGIPDAVGEFIRRGHQSSGTVFILERKNGIIKKNEYRVLDGAIGDSKTSIERNQQTLDDAVRKGFRPVGINFLGNEYDYSILVEKDSEIQPEGEYLILREVYGLNKKLSQLSQAGYKPLFIAQSFAILHRINNKPIQVSYEILDGSYASIPKKLAKWSEIGANYQISAVNGFGFGSQGFCDTSESTDYFAIPLKLPISNKKYDYKFLEMTNIMESMKNKLPLRTLSFRNPPTEEAVQKFYQLLREGYSIRDLSFGNDIMILFERPKM